MVQEDHPPLHDPLYYRWSTDDFKKLCPEWRKKELKKLEFGGDVLYYGPSMLWYGKKFQKLKNYAISMQVSGHGGTHRFAYENLECASIRKVVEMTSLILHGDIDPAPF